MRSLKHFLKYLILIVIAVLTMLYFFQEKLIFYSSEIPKDYVFQFDLDFEELFLTSDDGAVLNGLHFKQPSPKGVILYCHGNAGELNHWGFWAQELSNRYQYDVVIWDYRGYGKSTGKRRQQLMLDDGFLFYEYCKKHFSEGEITIFGRSLGGFFATHIAKDTNPDKLIIESAPTSLLNIAEKEYPLLPSKWLLKFRFQSDRNIPKIEVPTYFIHGTDDKLVPYAHGEALFKLSGAKTKELFKVKGGDHNDLASFDKGYFGALDKILR